MGKLDKSNIGAWFVCIVTLFLIYQHGIPTIYQWDVFGQYIYLPMIFDQHQLVYTDLSYFESINFNYNVSETLYQFVQHPNGNIMTKYTIGWSVMMLPFYLIAEVWAYLGSYSSNGFSFPYQFMMAFGASFYFIGSIFLLRHLLLKFFSSNIVLLVLISGVFGTNFLFMQYASLGSTHFLEFFLLCCLLLQTIRFYADISLKNGIILGFIIGLIAIVRPPDILFSLIPVFWSNGRFSSFKEKINFFLKGQKTIVSTTFTVCFSVLLIQFTYWRITSGKWIINSYSNNYGEGFDWFHPYLQEVLFSFRKGWFIYTPIAVLCLSGFYWWIKKNKSNFTFLLTFLIFLYVISCWTTWWYAASFSQRALIDIYPILFISFGFYLEYVRVNRFKLLHYALVSILILFNLFQTYQIAQGIIHNSRMTKTYYFSIFGQTSPPTQEQLKLLSVDRDNIYLHATSIDSSYQKRKTFRIDFNPDVILNTETMYTPILEYLPTELSQKEYFWIESKWFYEGKASALEGKIFNSATMYKENAYAWYGKSIHDSGIELDTLLKQVTFRYFTPHFRTLTDKIRIGVWAQSGNEIIIKRVEFSIFEPREIHQ